MMPLYGFLEGDTIGLLILAYEDETVSELADKLQDSAAVRVAKRPHVKLRWQGRDLDPNQTLTEVGIQPLDRFDVLRTED